MAKFKCCVVDCYSTSATHKLPTSPYLLALTKSQLLLKRVCERHFDHTQFDRIGARIRYSYSCLFTEKEMVHGVPLSSKEYNVLCEHNYCANRDSDDDDDNALEPIVVGGMRGDVVIDEHRYSLPSTSETQEKTSSKLQCEGDVLAGEHQYCLPSTSGTQDKSSSNLQCEDDTVNIAGHELFLFHDPPHLLKGIRNNFLDKDILFEGERASWEDILYVYDLDIKSGHTRALPKLTSEHVDPKKIKKMKVKAAAQVLSARTAAMLNYTSSIHERLHSPLETMETTAKVVLFFDDLFDSVNGSPSQTKGKLRRAVKPNSVHEAFWKTSLQKLKTIKYIDTKSKLALRSGKPRHVRVPSLDGWITTLNSFLGLTKLLFNTYNVEYFYPRVLNQDPLENFFGRVRALNYRNVSPDVNAFIYSFKSLVLSNILSPHSKLSNCEDDQGETLIDANYLFSTNSQNKENMPLNILHAPSSSSTPPRVETQVGVEPVYCEQVRVQTSAYTAGYICRKISQKINCKSCAKTYITTEIQGVPQIYTTQGI